MFPHDVDLLVDCGRLLSGSPGQQAIFKAADHVIVVTRPDGAGLAHAAWTLDIVRSLTTGMSSFVVVGPIQFAVSEMEHVLRTKLLGAIPRDEKSAAMACGTPGRPRRFARGNLINSARNLADRMVSQPTIGREVMLGPELNRVDDVGGPPNHPASADLTFGLAPSVELGADAL
jgi:MinD-like ATPase involved in chromosome partitioning or flagellar assembly